VQLYATTKSKGDRAGHKQQPNEFQHVVIKTQILSTVEVTQHTDITLDY